MRPRLLAITMGMFTILGGCKSAHAPLTVAPAVELSRFMGTWYVIGNIPTSLERDAFNPVESYRLDVDGTIETTFSFREGGVRRSVEELTAPAVSCATRRSNAVWGMRFVWPIKSDYRIVYVNENYERTVVGREKRDYVWIMARTPQIADSDYDELVAMVGREGYDVRKVASRAAAMAGKFSAANGNVPVKIAIIGSGIAGNVAAYHLHREHEITLFEAGHHVGGHTHTHEIEHEGRRIAVDTGFIVCNDRTYPHFMALLGELGVQVQPSEMSFSVQCNSSGLEYNGTTLNRLFAQRRNLLRPALLADDSRHPALQSRSATAAGAARRSDHDRRLSTPKRLLAGIRRPLHSADGCGHLERRPCDRARFSRCILRAFLPQPRNADGRRSAAVARDSRRFGALRREAHRFLPRAHPLANGRWNPCGGFRPGSCSRLRRAQRSASTGSSSPVTAIRRCVCWPTPPIRNARCSAPSATSATTCCCTRISRVLPSRKRAWAAWNYHLLDRSTERVAVTYNMNLLQRLETNTPLLCHLNMSDRDRLRRVSSGDWPTSIRCSRPRPWPRSRATPRSTAPIARISAAHIGVLDSTKTAS